MSSTSLAPFLPPRLEAETEKEIISTALAPAPRRKTIRLARPGTAPSSMTFNSSSSNNNKANSFDSPLRTSITSSNPSSSEDQPLLFQPSPGTIKRPVQVRSSSALELSRPDEVIQPTNQTSKADAPAENGEPAVDRKELETSMDKEKVEKLEEVEKVAEGKASSPWTLPIGGGRVQSGSASASTSSPSFAITSSGIESSTPPSLIFSQLTKDDPAVEEAHVVEITEKPSLLSSRSPTPTTLSPSRGLKSPLRRPSTADSAHSSGGRSTGPPTPPPKSPRHLMRLHPVFDSTIPLPQIPANLSTSATSPNLSSSSSSFSNTDQIPKASSLTNIQATAQPIQIPSVKIMASQTPPMPSESTFGQSQDRSTDSNLSVLSAPLSPQSPGASSISSSSSTSTRRIKRKPVPFDCKGEDSTGSGRPSSSLSYVAPLRNDEERRASSAGPGGLPSSAHQRSPSGSDVMKAAQEAAMAHLAARKSNGSGPSPSSQLSPLPSSPSRSPQRHSYNSAINPSPSEPDAWRASGAVSARKISRPRPTTAPDGSAVLVRESFASSGQKKKSPSVLMIEGQTFLLDSPAAKERMAALSRNSQDSSFSETDLINEDLDSELGDEGEEAETDNVEREAEEELSNGLDSSNKEEESSGSDDAPSAFDKHAKGNRNRSDTFTSSATSTSGSHFSTAPLAYSDRRSEQSTREEEASGNQDVSAKSAVDPTSPTTSTAPPSSMGPSLTSYNTAPDVVGRDQANFNSISSIMEPEFEAEDVIYDFSEGGTKDAPPPGSYAIHPPTVDQLIQASNCIIFDEQSDPVQFGSVFREGRTLVCFLRHWWCGFCQEFAMSLASIDMLPLQRAGLNLVVIGQGSAHVTAAYKQVMNVPFPMYADPERNVYKALGMNLRTNDAGPACAVPDYVQSGMTKSIVVAIKRGLFDMPIRAPGDMKLLGGEFILGPGLQCSFTHRMVTTRGHLDLPRILAQAGCDMSLKSPKAVIEESISSRPASTKSLGRSKSRLNIRRKKERKGDTSADFSMAKTLPGNDNHHQLEKAISAISAHSAKSKTKSKNSRKEKEPRQRESSEVSGRSSTLPSFRRNKSIFGKLAIGNTSQSSLASASIRSAATELYNEPSSGENSSSNSDRKLSFQSLSQREEVPRSSLSFSIHEEKREKGRFSKSKNGKAVTKAKSSADLGNPTNPKTPLSARFSGLPSLSRRPDTAPEEGRESLEANGVKAKDTLERTSSHDSSSKSNLTFLNNKNLKDEVVHITSLQPRPKPKSSNSGLFSSSQEDEIKINQSPIPPSNSTSSSSSSPNLSQSNDDHSTPRPNKLQHAFLDTDPRQTKAFRTPKPEEWVESSHSKTANSSSQSSPVQPSSPEDRVFNSDSINDMSEKEFQENLRRKVRAAAGIREDLDVDSLKARRDQFMRNDLNGSGGFGEGSFLDGLDAFDALPGTRAREERYLDELEMENTIEEEDESFLEDDDEEEVAEEDVEEDQIVQAGEEPQSSHRSTTSKSPYPSSNDEFYSDSNLSDYEEDGFPNQKKSNGTNGWESQSYSSDSEGFDPKDPTSTKHSRTSSNGSINSNSSSTSSVGVASSNLHGSIWRPLDPTPRPSMLESIQNKRLSAFPEEEEDEEEEEEIKKTVNHHHYHSKDDRDVDINSYYEREFSMDSQRTSESESWRDSFHGNDNIYNNGNSNGRSRRSIDSFEEARTPLAKVNELPSEALWA